jgi:hypothetical protein
MVATFVLEPSIVAHALVETSDTPSRAEAYLVETLYWALNDTEKMQLVDVSSALAGAGYTVSLLQETTAPSTLTPAVDISSIVPALQSQSGVLYLSAHGGAQGMALELFDPDTSGVGFAARNQRMAQLNVLYPNKVYSTSVEFGGQVYPGVGVFWNPGLTTWYVGSQSILHLSTCATPPGLSWPIARTVVGYAVDVSLDDASYDFFNFWNSMAGYLVAPTGQIGTRMAGGAILSLPTPNGGLTLLGGVGNTTLCPAVETVTTPFYTAGDPIPANGAEVVFHFDTHMDRYSVPASAAVAYSGDLVPFGAWWNSDTTLSAYVQPAPVSEPSGWVGLAGGVLYSRNSSPAHQFLLDGNAVVPNGDPCPGVPLGDFTALGESFVVSPDNVSGHYGIKLEWSESDTSRNVTYYIDRSTSCFGPWTQILHVDSDGGSSYLILDSQYNQPPYDPTVFTPDYEPPQYFTTYYYRIACVEEVLFGSSNGCDPQWQCEEGVEYPDLPIATPPGVPSWLTAEATPAGNGKVDVSVRWPRSSGSTTEYNLFRSRFVPLACYEGILEHVATQPEEYLTEYLYVDKGVNAGIPYYYWIVTSNEQTSAQRTSQVAWVLNPTGTPGGLAMSVEKPYLCPSWGGRGDTALEFGIPKDCDAVLRLYNVLGRTVKTLHSGTARAGVHRVHWTQEGDSGQMVSSGIYFAVLDIDGRREATSKVVVVR